MNVYAYNCKGTIKLKYNDNSMTDW
jgi:hypothetical protein